MPGSLSWRRKPRAARCAAKREREHLSNSDALFEQIKALKQEIAEGDAADKVNNAYMDGLEEALEELEVELVGERAKVLEAQALAEQYRFEAVENDQIRADAEREVKDLQEENEGLVEEKGELEKQLAEGDKESVENLAVAGDLLRDYLVASFESSGRLPRELKALADHLEVGW